MRKPTCPEFHHEVSERESGEAVSIDRNPVVDEVVFKTSENARDFDVIFNAVLSVDEVIETVVFEVFDRFR